MRKHIFPALKLTILTLFFFSGVYTAVVWAIAQTAPNKGKGKTVLVEGRKYYTGIGQLITEDRYFNSRPSAVDYNAAGSGGSNKGPSNPEYLQTVLARIDTFLVHNPDVKRSEVPVELVTASASGLDPHLSLKAALIQVKRIARIRKITEQSLTDLVHRQVSKPVAGLFGPKVVNVLELNLALDKMQ